MSAPVKSATLERKNAKLAVAVHPGPSAADSNVASCADGKAIPFDAVRHVTPAKKVGIFSCSLSPEQPEEFALTPMENRLILAYRKTREDYQIILLKFAEAQALSVPRRVVQALRLVVGAK